MLWILSWWDNSAAVGATSALINVFTNFFIGISLGTNVLAARFFASGKIKEMSDTVHTSILFAAISGVVMMIVGLLFSRFALELMETPDEVIDMAALYLKIYFVGVPFFMLYNYGAAVLRAVGDTRRPLVFLVISGAVNAILNMVLVILFHVDVEGVAIATVISQMISCVLVLRCLCKTDACYQLHFSKLSINGKYLQQIFQVGVPAGIQSTVINFSNVLLQSSVNSFGSIAMAGYTAANNLLGFLYTSSSLSAELILLNSVKVIIPSPLKLSSPSKLIFPGRFLKYLALCVMSSPISPFPLVTALCKTP